jgi:RHS repeat-associated protein
MLGENGTQTRTFQYDRRGLLTSETHPELGSTGGSSVTYSNYDALGKAHRRTRGGLDLAFDYDSAERVTRVYPFGSSSSWKQFVYDDPNGATYPQCAGGICNGKLIASTRWNQYPDAAHLQTVTETWHYDASTGMANQRDDSIGLTGDAFRVQRSFNDAGLLASTTYPCRVSNGACADSARNVTDGYTRGLLTSVGTWSDAITYQANGMVASVHHTNGMSETWTPDPHGMARPCSIIGTGSGGTVVTSSTDPCGSVLQGSAWTSGQYLYDGAGNVTQIGTTVYQYDAVNRLASWSSPGPVGGTISRSVTLDAYGNFLSMKVSRCQTAGACFHSSQVAGRISGTTNHYANVTYDDAGNVTNDGRQFTYDTVGMMATSTTGSRSYRYLYTADDERIGIVEVTGTPAYTWTIRGFGDEILRNYRGTGTGMAWVEDEIWRGGSLLANERPSLTRHYALDHLGSPRALTGSTGTFLGTQDFQPYGTGGTTDGGALQFTGHERDAELLGDTSGSMPDYFHARSYDVARGRFLSVDPNVDNEKAAHEPQLWSRYTYVGNNPLRYMDPDGRERLGYWNSGREPVPDRGFKTEMVETSKTAALFGGVLVGPALAAESAFEGTLFLMRSPGTVLAAMKLLDLMGGDSSRHINPAGQTGNKLGYLLGEYESSGGKGGLFAGLLGFDKKTLDAAIRSHFAENLAESELQENGRLAVTGAMTGANDVVRTITTIWQWNKKTGLWDLITGYQGAK